MLLLQDDCLSVLPTLPDSSIDLLLVDPPYGVNFQSNRVPTSRKRPRIANDRQPFTAFLPLVPRILKASGSAIIFTRWDVVGEWHAEMQDCGLTPKSCLVWDKCTHGMGDICRAFSPCYELALFAPMQDFRFQGSRPNDILRFPKVAHQRLVHPNEKPVDLLAYLIETCCPPGGVVLDCCMGSGSTGVAAVRTGRDFIGVELDAGHFATAEERIGKAVEGVSSGR